MLRQNGQMSAWFTDSFRFERLPDFLPPDNPLKNAEMMIEDDYGMIDGIINNGPKEEKQPETVKRASIMDRLKEAKSEKPIKKDAPAKAKSNDLEI